MIRNQFQFFFFRYDSGQPIIYPGMQLRRALTEAVRAFGAGETDPCLDEMVVIGHRQGGLLTKLIAIDSGDLFWRSVSDAPIKDAGLSDETRKPLEEAMSTKPLPFVRRVLFIEKALDLQMRGSAFGTFSRVSRSKAVAEYSGA